MATQKQVELYTGRKVDDSEFYFCLDDLGHQLIGLWNITDKPQPTIAELEALQPQVEAMEIKMLKLTPREFILKLMNLGITRQQLQEIINSNDRVWAELNYATVIVRGNPLLDEMCESLNITPQQLDTLFKDN